jgi:aldehyde:ferredoxin oxidoreductase
MTGMMKISPEDSMALFGTPYGGEQDTYRGKAEVVYWYELLKGVVDAVGVCYFTSKWVDITYLGPEEFAGLLSAATGRPFTAEGLMMVGRRIHNIEKAFNTLHAGFGVEDDYPPRRFFEEPVKTGPYEGACFTPSEWKTMLEAYYRLHGWDTATGLQTESTLSELDLTFVAEELKRAGKLGG